TKIPEPMVAPRPMAMSAGALSTCFRRLLPEESAGSTGRTAHSCRRIEARGAPAPRRLSLLIALDITPAFFHPRARPRQSLIRDGAQVRGRLGVGGVLAFAPPARSVQPATLFRRSSMSTAATPRVAPPPQGARITISNGKLIVPENPIIPFIEGDGTGADIWRASVRVMDAAVAKAYGGRRRIHWMEVYAGEKSNKL